MKDFLIQFIDMAALCGMRLVAPVVSYDMAVVDPADTVRNTAIMERAANHAHRLVDTLKAL